MLQGGGYGGSDQTCTQVASSPPYFCGSPPSRVSNPLIQDARFGDEKITTISPRSIIPNPTSGVPSSSPSSSSRKGGCLRPNYGNKPAVRIEGFDCLNRDNRRNCSIPGLAWTKPLIQKHTSIIKSTYKKRWNQTQLFEYTSASLVSSHSILAFWRGILHILKKIHPPHLGTFNVYRFKKRGLLLICMYLSNLVSY